jgi:hypothetical protein
MRQRKRPVCCDFCGSDTTNMDRLCSRCLEGVERHAEPVKAMDDDEPHYLRGMVCCRECGATYADCRCGDVALARLALLECTE